MAEKDILKLSSTRRILRVICEVLFPFEIEWKPRRYTPTLEASAARDVEEALTAEALFGEYIDEELATQEKEQVA